VSGAALCAGLVLPGWPTGLGAACNITPDVPDRVTVDAYAAVDVDRLILRPRPEMDAAAVERFAAETSRALGLTA
jgi:hypothetical protein